MDEALLRRVLDEYGVAYSKVEAAQKGYRNHVFPVVLKNGKKINLILYKSEPGILDKIKNANKVADFVAKSGLPARQTYKKDIICLQAKNFVKHGAIYSYLPGHTIPWEAYTMDHIKLLGQTTSDMHSVLKTFKEVDSLPSVAREYMGIVRRMQKYFSDKAVKDALLTKLGLKVPLSIFEQYNTVLAASDNLNGKQALHMDFVRSNILFEEVKNNEFKTSISGILDFEKAAYGHVLFDIARTLSFLLVDCKYKAPQKVRKYFLVSGYNKRGAQKFTDITLLINGRKFSLLEVLLDIFLMYDFYKFLRHNPYESLPDNEHFERTANILLERKRLVSCP